MPILEIFKNKLYSRFLKDVIMYKVRRLNFMSFGVSSNFMLHVHIFTHAHTRGLGKGFN